MWHPILKDITLSIEGDIQEETPIVTLSKMIYKRVHEDQNFHLMPSHIQEFKETYFQNDEDEFQQFLNHPEDFMSELIDFFMDKDADQVSADEEVQDVFYGV